MERSRNAVVRKVRVFFKQYNLFLSYSQPVFLYLRLDFGSFAERY